MSGVFSLLGLAVALLQPVTFLPSVGPAAGTYGGGGTVITSLAKDAQGRITAITAGSVSSAGGVSGSGTAGYLALWGASSLGSSTVQDDGLGDIIIAPSGAGVAMFINAGGTGLNGDAFVIGAGDGGTGNTNGGNFGLSAGNKQGSGHYGDLYLGGADGTMTTYARNVYLGSTAYTTTVAIGANTTLPTGKTLVVGSNTLVGTVTDKLRGEMV